MRNTRDAALDPHVRVSRADAITGGVSAGVLASLVMGLFWMTVTAFDGMSFFAPMEWIGATYLRESWSSFPVVSSMLGIATLFAFGAILGAIFGLAMRGVARVSARLALGAIFGAAVFIAMTFLVLPWANPILYESLDRGTFFLCHLAYGGTLAIALPLPQRHTIALTHR